MDMDRVAPSVPRNVRYVVTLDWDTRLPRDTVRRLIGKMAHPLNSPRFDAERGAIVEGYAVLQPRVTPSLPNGGEGSLFDRVFSSSTDIDPYAAAVSDVYQDVFCEGSYAGKGIYDLDAFERVLSGRTPDFDFAKPRPFRGDLRARALRFGRRSRGRFSIAIRRERPASPPLGAGRLATLACILGLAGKGARKPGVMDELPRIGRWKMIDNLRRTVSAPACVLALAVGWALSFESALVWTTFLITTIALPSLIPVISAIPGRRPGVAMSGHLRALAGRAPPRCDSIER